LGCYVRAKAPSPKFVKSRRTREKGRGAREAHKRLLYSFNVNRTSQDHLLLGGNADVDKSVECSEYSAGKFQNKSFLSLLVWALETSYR
jgi:hypothetical protein